MLDRRDPEYGHNREAAKILLDDNWRKGFIGDATYLRSLMILGYGDNDARTELSLLQMEKNKRHQCECGWQQSRCQWPNCERGT